MGFWDVMKFLQRQGFEGATKAVKVGKPRKGIDTDDYEHEDITMRRNEMFASFYSIVSNARRPLSYHDSLLIKTASTPLKPADQPLQASRPECQYTRAQNAVQLRELLRLS